MRGRHLQIAPSTPDDSSSLHEWLHAWPAALAGCLTSGLANIAAARGITLYEVSSTVVGDIDLLGILRLDPDVRNGYQRIKVTFTISGDATPEQLGELVEHSKRRSAVFDVLTNGTQVDLDVCAV